MYMNVRFSSTRPTPRVNLLPSGENQYFIYHFHLQLVGTAAVSNMFM